MAMDSVVIALLAAYWIVPPVCDGEAVELERRHQFPQELEMVMRDQCSKLLHHIVSRILHVGLDGGCAAYR